MISMYTPNKAAEAILDGHFEAAKALLDSGESLSGQYVANNKSQLFSSIIRHKAFDLVPSLVKAGLIGMDIYEYDSFDRTFFADVAQQMKADDASIAFLQDFLQQVDNKNDEIKDQTLLGYFLDKGADPAVIRCLIDAGCDARYKNNAERNFIFQVVNRQMLPEEQGIAYLDVLLKAGAEVNEKDIIGTTPLMAAVHHRKTAYASWLLQHGANPSEQDQKGNTAFYYAAAQQMDSEMLELLCTYGTPDFGLKNKEGATIVSEFMRMMQGSQSDLQLLDVLLKAGADLTQTAHYYGQPKSGVDWLAEKKVEVLQFVLAAHAIDMHAQDNKGNTILHQVCGYNINFDAALARDLYKKVKLLLEAGADPLMTNDEDQTPLQLAQQDNLKIKTVELLMSRS